MSEDWRDWAKEKPNPTAPRLTESEIKRHFGPGFNRQKAYDSWLAENGLMDTPQARADFGW